MRGIAALIAVALAGCTWQGGLVIPGHEHNNYCGHAYFQGVHLDPTPRDFAGADAHRGPLWENEIRWRDPWRGNRPVPERPVPWTVPGGNPADRGLPAWPQQATEESP